MFAPVLPACRVARFALLVIFATGCTSLSTVVKKEISDFGYDPADDLGPDHWADEFRTCSGKYQSPIDIEESLVTTVSLPDLRFTGFVDPPQSSLITNNGHTVLLQFNHSEPMMVSGGPLHGNYTFQQLHFHWGVNDSTGSEDLINNHSYPMELHMVFFKTEYGDFEAALDYKDGLVVLATFYEVSEHDNVVYSEMIQSLPQIEWPHTTVLLKPYRPLQTLLPANRDHYFTYQGSLTTPPCFEVVTWIDFKHPVRLSHHQLEAFRRLRAKKGYLTHNARPVQALYGREVWYNIGETENASAERREILQALTIVSLSLAAFAVL